MQSEATVSSPVVETPVSLVVGGAGGIGEAICVALVAEGGHVAIADLPGALEHASTRVVAASRGGEVSSVSCDVSSEPAVRDAVAATLGRFGSIDVLVNCAGVTGSRTAVMDMELADWERVMQVNLTGAFLASKHVSRHFVERGDGGVIVNVSSTAAKLPRPGQAAYCSSKAALVHFTRVLALELAPHDVRVNAICPGATRTPFLAQAAAAEGLDEDALMHNIVAGDLASFRTGIPLSRLAEPWDHAEFVRFLSSPAARHVTGQVIYVDGGEAMY